MRITKSMRIGVAAFGLLIVLVGLVARSFEAEYGSGLNFMVESDGSGVHTVYEVDEMNPGDDGSPSLAAVFEGTEAEASEYIERRRAEGTNLTGPWLIIGAGALVMLLSVMPVGQPRAS